MIPEPGRSDEVREQSRRTRSCRSDEVPEQSRYVIPEPCRSDEVPEQSRCVTREQSRFQCRAVMVPEQYRF